MGVAAKGDTHGVWQSSLEAELEKKNTRKLVAKLFAATGFLSVWMTVLLDDELMCQKLIEAFPRTRM